MKAQRVTLDSDVISDLPLSVIQNVLTFLPIRDAFKTSILCRKWRYHCLTIPKLEFNDILLCGTTRNQLSNKYRALLVIYTILLLHHGPVVDFSLCITQLQSCCEIDQIIHHLAKNATLEKFTLWIGSGNDHKLPSSFFSLQKLTHVTLNRCAIHPPSTFSGFGMLISLCFHNVKITKTVLLHFLRRCPLLKNFTLIEDDEHFTGSGRSDFVDLFQCLPSIEYLHMNCCPVKLFALGVLPNKFTNTIVHLKVLCLSGLSFVNEVELRSLLLLVTSSPNIEKIKLKMNYNPDEAMSQTVMSLLHSKEYSHVCLDRLYELEITDFSGVKPEMDFVEVILAKSPMLKKLRLVMHYEIDSEEKGWILEELIELPRASSRAKVIVRSH